MSAKVIPEKIHLTAFRILRAEMKSPIEFDSEKIISFETTTDFDLEFNLDDSMVKAEINVKVKSVSEPETNLEESFAQFHLAFIFHVENFKELAVVLNNDTLELKGGLPNALAAIAYSTTRGILMTRFQGTALSDFILPVIDPNDLLGK